MIQACPNCKPHEFQDALYGQQRRVMNPLKKTVGQPQEVRCTVCGAVAKATGEDAAR